MVVELYSTFLVVVDDGVAYCARDGGSAGAGVVDYAYSCLYAVGCEYRAGVRSYVVDGAGVDRYCCRDGGAAVDEYAVLVGVMGCQSGYCEATGDEVCNIASCGVDHA